MDFYVSGELYWVNALFVKYRRGGRGEIVNLKDKSSYHGDKNAALSVEITIPRTIGLEYDIKTSYLILWWKQIITMKSIQNLLLLKHWN